MENILLNIKKLKSEKQQLCKEKNPGSRFVEIQMQIIKSDNRDRIESEYCEILLYQYMQTSYYL